MCVRREHTWLHVDTEPHPGALVNMAMWRTHRPGQVRHASGHTRTDVCSLAGTLTVTHVDVPLGLIMHRDVGESTRACICVSTQGHMWLHVHIDPHAFRVHLDVASQLTHRWDQGHTRVRVCT